MGKMDCGTAVSGDGSGIFDCAAGTINIHAVSTSGDGSARCVGKQATSLQIDAVAARPADTALIDDRPGGGGGNAVARSIDRAGRGDLHRTEVAAGVEDDAAGVAPRDL